MQSFSGLSGCVRVQYWSGAPKFDKMGGLARYLCCPVCRDIACQVSVSYLIYLYQKIGQKIGQKSPD